MTVVKPTAQIKPNSSVRPAPVFVGPTDKEIADLQVKKAGLLNDIDTALKEINTLASKKSVITREIVKEQEIYDSMVLKPHAELAAELEKKLGSHNETLNGLDQKLQAINAEIKTRETHLSNLWEDIAKLQDEIQTKRIEFSKEVTGEQKKLADIKGEIEVAQTELQNTIISTEIVKKEAVEAKKTTEAERLRQLDYAASLERKARDLAIWQRRLDPLFKAKYPDNEMTFI